MCWKNKNLRLVSAIILILIGGFFITPKFSLAATGINKQINFQGKVVNTDGTNVTNGSYNFSFRIYSQQYPGGSVIWSEISKSLTVTDGIFQTNLGDATALPGSVDFNTDNIYLSIEFNGNGEMNPRIQFTASPYAFNSNNLEGKTWEVPGAIGSGTPSTAAFTTLSSTGNSQIATTGGSTLSLGNSTGVATLASGGTSSWTNTSGSLTISTATSGTLALTSVGALNLSGISLNVDTSATNDTINIEQGTYDSILSFTQPASATQTYTFVTGGTVATTSNKLSAFAATTSAELSSVLSNENTSGGYMTDPMTTAGDLIYGGASGVPTRLAGSGTNGWVLTYNTSTNAPYWAAAAGGGGTLQNAYDATSGNTILTTTGKNITFTLGEVAAPTSFTVENQDTAGVSTERIYNSIASGTLTNGLLIEETGAGTMTNAINITETSGTITTGINIGTVGTGIAIANGVTTGITIGTGTTTGISIASGGITITGGALAINNSTGITSDQATMIINAGGTVNVQDTLNADALTTDTSGVTIASGQSYSGTGAVTLASASATGLTIDSGTTGAINIGTSDNAKTITMGNATGATAVNINSGSGGIKFEVAGASTTGSVQIGTGGNGVANPDLLKLDVRDSGTSGDPTGANGAMYYSANTNKFRCYQNSAWTDCIGSGSGGGDNVSVNGTAATDADFDNATVAAPNGGANVKWQKDTSTPNNISAYFDFGDFNTPFKKKPTFASDFHGGSGAVYYNLPFLGAAISSGTINSATAAAINGDHPGIVRMLSSTTTNGGYRFQTANGALTSAPSNIRLKGGEVFNGVVYHNNISTTTVRIGFHDSITSADAVDGCYFEIPASTGAVVGKCSNSSTRTTTASSYTISTATWYSYRITMNSSATLATFEIFNSAGTSLFTTNNTVASNIPTASGRETGVGIVATESSTTATDMVNLDYMSYSMGTTNVLAR